MTKTDPRLLTPEQMADKLLWVESYPDSAAKIQALVILDHAVAQQEKLAAQEERIQDLDKQNASMFQRCMEYQAQIASLTAERDQAIFAKRHTQDWYGSRWERMSEWFRSSEMKGTKAAHDWFGIVANGGLLEDAPPVCFMASVNQARYFLKTAQERIAALEKQLEAAKDHQANTDARVVNQRNEIKQAAGELETTRKRMNNFRKWWEEWQGRAERAEKQLGNAREALEPVSTLLWFMETCHMCSGTLSLEDIEPPHCEDCSGDCDNHEEPGCEPIQVFHTAAKGAITRALAVLSATPPAQPETAAEPQEKPRRCNSILCQLAGIHSAECDARYGAECHGTGEKPR